MKIKVERGMINGLKVPPVKGLARSASSASLSSHGSFESAASARRLTKSGGGVLERAREAAREAARKARKARTHVSTSTTNKNRAENAPDYASVRSVGSKGSKSSFASRLSNFSAASRSSLKSFGSAASRGVRAVRGAASAATMTAAQRQNRKDALARRQEEKTRRKIEAAQARLQAEENALSEAASNAARVREGVERAATTAAATTALSEDVGRAIADIPTEYNALADYVLENASSLGLNSSVVLDALQSNKSLRGIFTEDKRGNTLEDLLKSLSTQPNLENLEIATQVLGGLVADHLAAKMLSQVTPIQDMPEPVDFPSFLFRQDNEEGHDVQKALTYLYAAAINLMQGKIKLEGYWDFDLYDKTVHDNVKFSVQPNDTPTAEKCIEAFLVLCFKQNMNAEKIFTALPALSEDKATQVEQLQAILYVLLKIKKSPSFEWPLVLDGFIDLLREKIGETANNLEADYKLRASEKAFSQHLTTREEIAKAQSIAASTTSAIVYNNKNAGVESAAFYIWLYPDEAESNNLGNVYIALPGNPEIVHEVTHVTVGGREISVRGFNPQAIIALKNPDSLLEGVTSVKYSILPEDSGRGILETHEFKAHRSDRGDLTWVHTDLTPAAVAHQPYFAGEPGNPFDSFGTNTFDSFGTNPFDEAAAAQDKVEEYFFDDFDILIYPNGTIAIQFLNDDHANFITTVRSGSDTYDLGESTPPAVRDGAIVAIDSAYKNKNAGLSITYHDRNTNKQNFIDVIVPRKTSPSA